MRPDKTLGAAADCGVRCAEQDYVAGGKKAVCTFNGLVIYAIIHLLH